VSNMKFVVLIVTLLNFSVQGRFNNDFIKQKRQSVTCGLTYLSLTNDERSCLPHGSSSSSVNPELSVDQLERLCSSETCVNTAEKLLKDCKVNNVIMSQC